MNRPAGKPAEDPPKNRAGKPAPRSSLKAIKKAVLKRIGQPRYDAWVAQTLLSLPRPDLLRVEATSPFIRQYVEQHYSRALEEAATEVLGRKVLVEIKLAGTPQLLKALSS